MRTGPEQNATDRTTRPHAQAVAGCLVAAALVGAGLFSGGCVRPLLSPSDERSPFDRYDGIRNQYATQSVPDEYGRNRPNLRERLAPKD